MPSAFMSVNFAENKDVYSLWINLSEFEGTKIVSLREGLRTTISKDTVPYETHSTDWIICMLNRALREVRYEAKQHLSPGAIKPIGDGMQHTEPGSSPDLAT